MVKKVLGWSVPTAFIINVLICMATQKVIGMIPAYFASLPICYLANKAILDAKLIKYISAKEEMQDRVDENNKNREKVQSALDKILSKIDSKDSKITQKKNVGAQTQTNSQENSQTNTQTQTQESKRIVQNTNNQNNHNVQLSDDFIRYYQRYYMNNGGQVKEEGPKRTLKR